MLTGCLAHAATADLLAIADRSGLLEYLGENRSAMHCMTQSLSVGGEGLGSAWGAQMAEAMSTESGFSSFEHREGISNKFLSFYLLSP